MNTLLQVGIVLTAMDKMSGVLTGAADKAAAGFARLQQRVVRVGQALTEMGTKASLMGHGILAGLETPIKAFADLNEASTDLRVAMLDNLGQVPPQFAEITRQSVELGNVLKGNTADFTNAATALLENGTSIESITNGGLKAASYLGVILKQVPAQAAEMTAKFREAFGLADNELVKMADLTQRAKFAFGLSPEEIKYAAQYAGATLNNLRLTGIENTRMFLAMQGIARQKGMEGSVFGTNFSSMLNNIGMMEAKLGRNSKIMKEVNADLARAGINLQFFDQAGKFVGLEKMVGELEKLKVLSEQQRLNVMNKVFGMEGGRVASMLSSSGSAGLQNALATMQRQADLMQRIDEVNKSAKNTWEALTGTVTNFWAAVGGPMVTALYPLINKVNAFVGGPLMAWVDRNKDLVKWLGLAALATGALLVALGGLGIVAGAVASGLAVIVGAAVAVIGPIGVAIAGIAAGGALIVSYWGQITGFFKGLWQGLKAGLAPLGSIGSQVAAAFSPLLAIGRALYFVFIRPFVVLYQWVSRLVAPIMQSAAAAEAFGFRVGRAIGAAITWVARLYQGLVNFPGKVLGAVGQAVSGGLSATMQAVSRAATAVSEVGSKILSTFLALPGKLFSAGVAIIEQLWAGIKSAASKLYAGVAEVAAKVRSYWPFSPAKAGPLRDLHRVRIIETIAGSINPAPLSRAMHTAAAAGLLALAPLANAHAMGMPGMLPQSPTPQAASLATPHTIQPTGGRAAAPVTVHFAPQITIQGQTGATSRDDIMAALKVHEHELVALIEQVMARNARRQY